MLEKDIENQIRIDVSKIGTRIFRNPTGMLTVLAGSYIRNNGKVRQLNRDMVIKYGLHVGSCDEIGWTPIIITPEHVGRRVGVFTALEVKRIKVGRLSPDQLNFITQVQLAGGIAGVVHSSNEALELICGYQPLFV